MPNIKTRSHKKDTLPDNFTSLEEFCEFWDTHSSPDYEDLMTPVNVEIQLSSENVYCPVAKDVMQQVRTRAYQQGISTETLVNLWLQEKAAHLA